MSAATTVPSRGVATLTLDTGTTVEGIGFHYYGQLGYFNVRYATLLQGGVASEFVGPEAFGRRGPSSVSLYVPSFAVVLFI